MVTGCSGGKGGCFPEKFDRCLNLEKERGISFRYLGRGSFLQSWNKGGRLFSRAAHAVLDPCIFRSIAWFRSTKIGSAFVVLLAAVFAQELFRWKPVSRRGKKRSKGRRPAVAAESRTVL